MVRIGIIGAGTCSKEVYQTAEKLGRLIAERGDTLICGGLGGVMEAAAKGAKSNGGTTIGILPGFSVEDANPFIDIPIVTGLSHARNVIIVRSSDILIAVAGEYGTLSEIAIALKLGKPVIGICSWNISKDILQARSPEEAIRLVDKFIKEDGLYDKQG
tara:strand:- start:2997 stop:3473 length:477 start_codon:yes stop_codon:yes gene_type:complete